MNNLPIQEPVFIFAIVMTVIFFAPFVMRLLKLPEIIGMIFFGIILGPNGLNILERDTGIFLFGTVGVIFIMFSSGLEVDLKDFKKKKDKSIIFGLLTFILPFAAGIVAGYFILRFNIMSSLLLGSVFASHTLLTYPTVGKIGIKDNESVVIAVGGTLITNAVSMLILAIVAGEAASSGQWFDMPVIFACFSALVLILVPKISRWFFRVVSAETHVQYVFVITILFAVVALGKQLGIEPIIGAFLAGLALNMLIPAKSILMNRIDFTGNTLFIPFFLLYVGMLTDVRLLFSDWHIVALGVLMIFLAVATKYLAAVITQKIFKYSDAQKDLIFGLTNTQAAGTLAVIMVGVQMKLFPPIILDAAVLMMLATCIISAFYTEKSARKIAAENKANISSDTTKTEDEQEKILLLLSNPHTVPKLVDLALMMKNTTNENPIYPLTLVIDENNSNTSAEILQKQKLLEQAQKHASGTNELTHLITRVDTNVANGVKLAAKEYSITHTILGWNSSNGKSNFFGTILEHILDSCDNVIITARTINDWHAVKRFFLFMSPNAQYEYKFLSVLLPVLRIAVMLKKVVVFHGTRIQFEKVMKICAENNINLDFSFEENRKESIQKFAKRNIKTNDFSVIICGRKSSVSFSDEHRRLPDFLNSRFPKDNFLMVYPPQKRC